jgi:hypothetical protein
MPYVLPGYLIGRGGAFLPPCLQQYSKYLSPPTIRLAGKYIPCGNIYLTSIQKSFIMSCYANPACGTDNDCNITRLCANNAINKYRYIELLIQTGGREGNLSKVGYIFCNIVSKFILLL